MRDNCPRTLFLPRGMMTGRPGIIMVIHHSPVNTGISPRHHLLPWIISTFLTLLTITLWSHCLQSSQFAKNNQVAMMVNRTILCLLWFLPIVCDQFSDDWKTTAMKDNSIDDIGYDFEGNQI